MKYFPLTSDSFEHQFGIRALDRSEPIVETTSLYRKEIDEKRTALATDTAYYFQELPDSLASQREAASLIIDASSALSSTRNLITDEDLVMDAESPLLGISRHVQEDLTILRNDADRGFPLIAGSVCFPSGWCIGDKIGGSVTEIHAPVPEFAAVLGKATENLMQRLKVDRPVWRTNWGVRSSGQLDQSPRHRESLANQTASVTPKNAGRKCHFRVERQTLARLPATGDILFAIHTHQQPLADLDPIEKEHLLGVIRTCPRETLGYKGILPMRNAIESFLRDSVSL